MKCKKILVKATLDEYLWIEAFHLLDKSGWKKNKQIRLIRHIDYTMDYFIAFIKRDSSPLEIAECGPYKKT